MGKRTLGLSKAKSKKQKTEAKEPTEGGNQQELVIELPKDINPDNTIDAIKGLWTNYKNDYNELLLNGIIHECDRILRNGETVNDIFYCIYAKSIAELSKYLPEGDQSQQADNEQERQKILNEALERVDDGMEKFGDSIALHFVKAKIIIMNGINDDGLKLFERAIVLSETNQKDEYFDDENYEFLEMVAFLLRDEEEEGEEDDEDDNEDEEEQENEKENERETKISWLIQQNLKYLSHSDTSLHNKINKNIGDLYLQLSDTPSYVYTTLEYEDYPEPTIKGMDKQTSQTKAIEYLENAIKHFRAGQDDEDTDNWANIGESLINLGNVDDTRQEDLYQEAETILTKANNVTNGKYKDILQQLKE